MFFGMGHVGRQTVKVKANSTIVAVNPTVDLSFMTPGTLDPRITFTRASTATYFDSSGTLQTAATNAPRWDYNPSTRALNGLLIEEARTNLLLTSSNFGIAPWSVTAATVAGSAGTAPDGTNSLTLLSETSTTAGHYLAAGVLTVASTQYSLSIFVKAAGVRYLHIALDDGVVTGGYATFDLQTGTVSQIMTAIGAGVLGVASIQLISNGIYRCTIVTSIGTGVNARILFMCSNTGTPSAYPSYAGNAANGLLIWGAQIEAGAFPTSYIPTTAATVTRAIDSAIMSTSPWFTSPTAFSYVVDVLEPILAGVPTYVSFDDGTSNNRSQLRSDGANTNLVYSEFTGGSATVNGAGAGMAFFSNAVMRMGAIVAALPATRGFSLAGGFVQAASATLPPTGLTTLRLGKGTTVTTGSFYIRRFRYWPRALSNTELQSVTT